jgi:hypothetical protein
MATMFVWVIYFYLLLFNNNWFSIVISFFWPSMFF